MKDDKSLDNNELNEVSGGGLFGNQSEQRFKVGDIVYGDPTGLHDPLSIRGNRRGKIVECLGLEGVFYGTYEYIVLFDNGISTQKTQSSLKTHEEYCKQVLGG